MNSKQRRKARRSKYFKTPERALLISQLEKILDSKLTKRMNDPCPRYFEKCGHPKQEFEWNCFGKYNGCKYYKR